MYRGTTPTLKFVIPFDTDLITKLHIAFWQGEIVLLKTEADVEMEDNNIVLQFTQEETLMFSPCNDLSIQMRCILTNDAVLASSIVTTDINRILEEGVL